MQSNKVQKFKPVILRIYDTHPKIHNFTFLRTHNAIDSEYH